MFKVEIIADSVNPDNNRLTSFLLTYPRFIHSELMTHRVFSRNAASSRAIPIEKVMEQVRINPAGPIRWGKNGKGMQDHGEFTEDDSLFCQHEWNAARDLALEGAARLHKLGLHKQIVNRVLEPFAHMTTLVTATEWLNFFSLRVHKDAQPEFQYLAYHMLKAYLDHTPNQLDWADWHIPFGDRMPEDFLMPPDGTGVRHSRPLEQPDRIKISVARTARLSYLTMDGLIDVCKDFKMHDDLSGNGHWSPFEHPAMAERGRHGNFVGFKQYRKFFPDENRTCDLNKLLSDYEASLGY